MREREKLNFKINIFFPSILIDFYSAHTEKKNVSNNKNCQKKIYA